MILLVAGLIASCPGVCGLPQSNTQCVGSNQKCNPCIQYIEDPDDPASPNVAVCANDERLVYPPTPPALLVSNPDGCCYEESVAICKSEKVCIAPAVCDPAECTMPPVWDVTLSAHHIYIPGEDCGHLCLN